MPGIKLSRRRTLLFATLTLVTGIITISACSSEENPPAGSLSLALSPTSVNIAPGGSGTSEATITRSGSFTGAVTLSASGNPTGVTVTFSPAEIPGAATTATVEISVGAAVTTGDKTITISAAGTGVTTATATLTVVVVPATNGAIGLAADPGAVTANVGGAAVTSVITVSRTAPFTGPVALTVTGAPAGVTATVNPTSVTAATSTLTVLAATGAVNGPYPLVIHGAGTGVATATTTVTVTVAGGAAQGASFTFNPTSVPITAGGASATSVVTVTRSGGFIGPLTLAITGAPANMTATVAPNPNLNSATSTITVQATAAVAAGTYNLTLTGTATGIPNAIGTLPVVVTGGGGGGGNVSFTFCTEDAPIWVAVQDGAAGAWTQVTPTSGSTYQFAFPSGKGGIATVDTVGVGTNLSVIYGTLAEFTSATTAINNGGCDTDKSVNGSVTGVANTEFASVTLGTSTALVIPVSSTSFVLNDVPAGPQDLVATRIDATSQLVNWVILRRALNPADGATLPALAFGTEGSAPASANVTVTGLGSDTAFVVSLFAGVRGSSFAFLSSIEDYVAATPPQPFAAIPAGTLLANEVQELLAFSNEPNNTKNQRMAGLYFTTVSNRTVALGPELNAPTVTKVVTAPNARPSVSLVSQAQYNRLITADYSQSSINRGANVLATAGYFGSLPATWTVTLPDLVGATGWNTNWGLADGTPIAWTVSAEGGVIPFLDATITDGSASQSASIQSSTPLALRGLRAGNDHPAAQLRLFELLGDRNRSLFH